MLGAVEFSLGVLVYVLSCDVCCCVVEEVVGVVVEEVVVLNSVVVLREREREFLLFKVNFYACRSKHFSVTNIYTNSKPYAM